ncbi:MAG: phage late control D family protein [Pseudomonadota bacterium]
MGLDKTRPAYRLTANQDDITDAINKRLVSLRLTDKAGMDSDELVITLEDHDDQRPLALPPAGAELKLWIGYNDEADEMGVYVVDALEISWPPNQLKIIAKAAPLAESQSGQGSTRLMLQTKKTRSWDAGKTLGSITETIASEHGLTPAVQAEIASVVLPHIDQTDESDMNLLTRLARDHDGVVKPAGGALVLTKRGASQAANADATPLPTVPISPTMLTSGRMRLAKRGNAGSVIAHWRDTDEAATYEVTVGEGEPVQRLGQAYPNEEAAKAAARSELRRGERGEQTLDITLPGDTSLMAEGRLSLSGFREGADGEWLIEQVAHTIDDRGYSCRVKAELPGSE